MKPSKEEAEAKAQQHLKLVNEAAAAALIPLTATVEQMIELIAVVGPGLGIPEVEANEMVRQGMEKHLQVLKIMVLKVFGDDHASRTLVATTILRFAQEICQNQVEEFTNLKRIIEP
jgi:hypothetical protein